MIDDFNGQPVFLGVPDVSSSASLKSESFDISSNERDLALWLERIAIAAARRASLMPIWCRIVREISCFYNLNAGTSLL